MKESKNFIGYLTQKDVFKIPSNKNLEINRNFSSFVFNVDKANNLTMRYTMSEKNIEWKSSEQLPKIKVQYSVQISKSAFSIRFSWVSNNRAG